MSLTIRGNIKNATKEGFILGFVDPATKKTSIKDLKMAPHTFKTGNPVDVVVSASTPRNVLKVSKPSIVMTNGSVAKVISPDVITLKYNDPLTKTPVVKSNKKIAHNMRMGELVKIALTAAQPRLIVSVNKATPATPPTPRPVADITVDFKTVVKSGVPIPGFNCNPYANLDKKRPPGSRSYKDTLAVLKPGVIRPTNGYMADLILWAQEPTWLPSSQAPAVYGWDFWASNDAKLYTTPPVPGGKFIDVMNFSDFNIAKPKETAFVIAVPLMGAYVKNKAGDPVEKAQLLKTAVEWVKYCKARNIPVSYYEISNESTMSGNHIAHISAEQYAKDVITWSRAMKAVDPTARIAANGETAEEFTTIMNIAGNYIDAVVPHCYGPWDYPSYEVYATDKPKFTYNLDLCYKGLAASTNKRKVDIIITETNIIDYKKTLTPANDTGKALMIFDLLGQLMSADRVKEVVFWEDRAVNEGKDGFPKLLKTNNQLQPVGMAFYLWSSAIVKGTNFVKASVIPGIVSFATTSPNYDIIWLSNKTTETKTITLDVNTQKPLRISYVFKGKGYTDVSPALAKIPNPVVKSGIITLTLPPTSITSLFFK